MKRIRILGSLVTAAGFLFSTPFGAYGADDLASSIFGVTVWPGYRQWELDAVSRKAKRRVSTEIQSP
jgi:hypothetical protein